jgi:hypothetical protein
MIFYYIEVKDWERFNNFLGNCVVGSLSDMDTRDQLGGDGSLF